MQGLRQILLGLSILASGFFITWPHASPPPVQNVSADFSHYPRRDKYLPEDLLPEFFAMQSGDNSYTQNRTAVVAISKMLLEGRAAQQTTVAPNGREFHVREVFDWASQASGRRQLTTQQLDQLRAAVHDLPAQNSYPDIDHLVIVNFRDGAQWVTRCFDQRTPPAALTRIEAIIESAPEVSAAQLQGERDAEARKMVADARAAMPAGAKLPDMPLPEAVAKSVVIFTGTLTDLTGPLDADLGQARYYGNVLHVQFLREPSTPRTNLWVAIDGRLLPAYDEQRPNIFFAIKTDDGNPRTSQGSEYTILKFLPDTEANLAQVRKLLPANTNIK